MHETGSGDGESVRAEYDFSMPKSRKNPYLANLGGASAQMISNARIHLAIAEAAHAEMTRLVDAGRRPKPDGSQGHIVTYDPVQSSFKQALICIVFSAVYFEAVIYLVAASNFSKTRANEIDALSYERRLQAIGITDNALLESAKRLRVARRDLVHEKAIEPKEIASKPIFRAQKEAENSIDLIRKISTILLNNQSERKSYSEELDEQ